MNTKLVIVAALVLANVVAAPYRPARWPHAAKELRVINPPLIDEPIVAVHAIRWREMHYPVPREDIPGLPAHLRRLPVPGDWEVILEIANVSPYPVATVALDFTPTHSNPVVGSFVIERGEPVWFVFRTYIKPPPKPKDNNTPQPPRATTVGTKPKRPQFSKIEIEVVSVEEFVRSKP